MNQVFFNVWCISLAIVDDLYCFLKLVFPLWSCTLHFPMKTKKCVVVKAVLSKQVILLDICWDLNVKLFLREHNGFIE